MAYTNSSKSRFWFIGLLAVVLLVAGVIWSRQPSKTTNAPIVIGGLYPMTGGLAQYGELASKSAQLAIDQINAQGGINGRLLSLDIQDHQCLPAKAAPAFQVLATKETRYVLAAGCSGTIGAIAPMITNQVVLGSTISSPKVSGVSPRFFRNYGTDSAEAQLFATYITKHQLSSVGVLYEETDYAKGLMLALTKDLQGSSSTVVTESFTSDATDLRTQITKLKNQKPDVLFVSPQTVTTANIALKQMKELGYAPTVLIVNENIMKSEQLRAAYPELLNGAISADFRIQDSVALQSFLAAYKAKFGKDCAQVNVCATSYDNVLILAQTLHTVGDDDAKVAAALRTISYEGTSGHVSFTDKNDRESSGYALFTITNGTPTSL